MQSPPIGGASLPRPSDFRPVESRPSDLFPLFWRFTSGGLYRGAVEYHQCDGGEAQFQRPREGFRVRDKRSTVPPRF